MNITRELIEHYLRYVGEPKSIERARKRFAAGATPDVVLAHWNSPSAYRLGLCAAAEMAYSEGLPALHKKMLAAANVDLAAWEAAR